MELRINEPWITSKVRCQSGYARCSTNEERQDIDRQPNNFASKKIWYNHHLLFVLPIFTGFFILKSGTIWYNC